MVTGLTPSCTTAMRSGTSTVPGAPAGPMMTRPSMPTLMVKSPALRWHSRAMFTMLALIAHVERRRFARARLAADDQGRGAGAQRDARARHIFGRVGIVDAGRAQAEIVGIVGRAEKLGGQAARGAAAGEAETDQQKSRRGPCRLSVALRKHRWVPRFLSRPYSKPSVASPRRRRAPKPRQFGSSLQAGVEQVILPDAVDAQIAARIALALETGLFQQARPRRRCPGCRPPPADADAASRS